VLDAEHTKCYFSDVVVAGVFQFQCMNNIKLSHIGFLFICLFLRCNLTLWLVNESAYRRLSSVRRCSQCRQLTLILALTVTQTPIFPLLHKIHHYCAGRVHQKAQYNCLASVCPVGVFSATRQGAACDAASVMYMVHFGPTIRRTDIFATDRSRVQFPAGPLSRNIGQLY